MPYQSVRKLVTGVLVILLIASLIGCTPQPKSAADKPGEQKDLSKEHIITALSSKTDVQKITWSPNENMAAYLQAGKPDKKGVDEAYLWKVGEDQPKLVRDVKPTTHGFSWAPDSNHFLISEKLGEGVESSIVIADTLYEESYKVKSIGIPVWSPDSKSLAYGNETHEYGPSWGSLEVYTLGDPKSEYIWKAIDYLYKVESWDQEDNISYTEVDPQGKETRKTTKNIRPDISGVHLGDSKAQVEAALGKEYKETAPSGEMGHFPEQVYRLDYDGYKIFIGAESGGVLEITVDWPKAETNLGIKMGDTSAKVFETYRPKYIEPVSIHGGKIYGMFKVEGAAALNFQFDLKEGQSLSEIKPENKVIRMILTYPEIFDDSF